MKEREFTVIIERGEDGYYIGSVPELRGCHTRLVGAMQRFNLDFDDAYQYAVAERYGLTIISFDSDFDRTERSRKTPEDLLRGRR